MSSTDKNRKLLLLSTFITALSLSTGLLYAPGAPAANLKRPSLNLAKSISYTKGANSEKITIELQKKVSYKSRFLDKNPKKNIPYRLYLDLLNTRLSNKIKQAQYPEDSNIQRFRIAQRNNTTTRVVLDIEKKIYREDYKISQTTDPSKIVIELFPRQKHSSSAKTAKKPVQAKKHTESQKQVDKQGPPAEAPAMPAQKSALEEPSEKKSDICTIVIDPGHGGRDPGAIGYKGIKEKDVCFFIALKLKEILDTNFKCKTLLTRSRDIFVTLEERGQIANSNNADLFISIHANSHKDAALKGIETYYLNFSSDDNAREVAARENFTSPSEISDLELILFDLLQSEKINKSSLLAGYIHNELVAGLSKKYNDLRNLGIKHAPMRVLIEAEMPCVLIETAFLSNPSEAKRLKSNNYHEILARAIVEGIRNFINGQETAYYKKSLEKM